MDSSSDHERGSNSNVRAGCGRTSDGKQPLLLCGGCRSEYYCSSACQKAAWKAEHKAECKRRQNATQRILLSSSLGGAMQVAGGLMQHFADIGLPGSTSNAKDVHTPEQPPLVPGGPAIRAGGGKNFNYKLDAGLGGPIMFAAMQGDVSTVKALLEMGHDLHARVSGGSTPLHMCMTSAVSENDPALRQRMLQCMDVLLAHGADPNASEMNGMTPMHALCTLSYVNAKPWMAEPVVLKLLEAGADLSLKTKDGFTPWDMASRVPALAHIMKRVETEVKQRGRGLATAAK